MAARVLRGFSGLAFILLAGCFTREVIPISYAPETRPSAGRPGDYLDATKAIASVMVEDLKLPPIDAVMIVYPSSAEYEAGFITEAELTPGEASAKTRAAALASCQKRKVFANGEILARLVWSHRVKILSHEMTHLTMFALGNWQCESRHPWIAEGFADWITLKVIERLGLDTFAEGKKNFLESLGQLNSKRKLPTLGEISGPAEWDEWAKSSGRGPAYAQAFLAVDFLIERKGLPAAVEYFRLFGRSTNRPNNFRIAFGQDVATFDRQFGAHLKKLLM
jgi:hypothetical protein